MMREIRREFNGRVGNNALQSFFAKLPWLCLGLCWPRERESFVLEGLVSVLAAKQPKISHFFIIIIILLQRYIIRSYLCNKYKFYISPMEHFFLVLLYILKL